jgi:hypothetical protein
MMSLYEAHLGIPIRNYIPKFYSFLSVLLYFRSSIFLYAALDVLFPSLVMTSSALFLSIWVCSISFSGVRYSSVKVSLLFLSSFILETVQNI